jgi:hypothetical protein
LFFSYLSLSASRTLPPSHSILTQLSLPFTVRTAAVQLQVEQATSCKATFAPLLYTFVFFSAVLASSSHNRHQVCTGYRRGGSNGKCIGRCSPVVSFSAAMSFSNLVLSSVLFFFSCEFKRLRLGLPQLTAISRRFYSSPMYPFVFLISDPNCTYIVRNTSVSSIYRERERERESMTATVPNWPVGHCAVQHGSECGCVSTQTRRRIDQHNCRDQSAGPRAPNTGLSRIQYACYSRLRLGCASNTVQVNRSIARLL